MSERMERAEIYRRAIGLVLVVVALILLLSVASYSPHDPPRAYADYPPNDHATNMCGIAGACLAFAARHLFGAGSYLICFALGAVGVLMLIGRTVEDRFVRGLGAALFLLSWCGGIALILPTGGMPGGAGGLVGHFISRHLLTPIGAGGYLVALLGLALGALLAADAFVLWLGRKSVEMLTVRGEPPAPVPAADAADREKTSLEDRLAEQKELLRKRLEEQRAAAARAPAEPATEEPTATGDRPAAEATVLAAKEPPKRPTPKPPPKKEPPRAADYHMPGVDLLDPVPPPQDAKGRDENIEAKREVLERTLEEFGIVAQVVEIDRGPVITQFELELAAGVKIGRIIGLSDDLARALKAQSVRVVAPIPGKSTVGVEVPNAFRETVRLRELFDSGVLERKRTTLPLLLGKDAGGEPLIADLSHMPHLLIGGATGSGKSVCMNSIIMTFLMTQSPEDVKLILVDPKMVELSAFRDIPHLMAPVLTDMKKAAAVLEWATRKMDERYSLMSNVGVRNIAGYNGLGAEEIRRRLDVGPDDDLEGLPFHMPHIIIIIDELADLMLVAGKEVENSISRLAAKSRAVGIHLIVATQRPSVDVVTGLIKANLPSRLAFQMASKVDSRTILDRNGADKLLGRGDMLFLPPGSSELIRGQGSYTSDEEIRRVIAWVRDRAKPEFEPELVRPQGLDAGELGAQDELFGQAVRIILETRRGSVSLLQRKLSIGYSRAARLIDLMAEAGILGDYKGSQAREVLYTLEEWEARQEGQVPSQNGQ